MQRQSSLFGKTNKEAKEFESLNATLLTKAGFIHQEMAGVYSYLPLGKLVLDKIENLVREEMLKISNEINMPSLASKELWSTTGRIDSVDVLMKTIGANAKSYERNNVEYILNPTHEEVITPLAKEYIVSYKHFPFALFQIQTKFRNEARAKSGLLRGREFRMKDLYSFHTSIEDLKEYYEKVKKSYFIIFEKLGLKEYTVLVKASGGDFTNDYSDEFQVLCKNGEDIIYYDDKTNTYYNKEVASKDILHNGKNASEAGNIFILKDKFTKAFDYTYQTKDNKKGDIYMGCYGIGTSRVMGIIAENFNDNSGLIWPESISPYNIHLITYGKIKDSDIDKIKKIVEKKNKTILWDDRVDISMGEKLKDSDLIGISKRIILSEKSIQSGGVEIKERNKDKSNIIAIENIDKYI
jgi:prolyl-tRNA synthetase